MEVVEVVRGRHPDCLRLGRGGCEDEALVVDVTEGGIAVFVAIRLPRPVDDVAGSGVVELDVVDVVPRVGDDFPAFVFDGGVTEEHVMFVG